MFTQEQIDLIEQLIKAIIVNQQPEADSYDALLIMEIKEQMLHLE